MKSRRAAPAKMENQTSITGIYIDGTLKRGNDLLGALLPLAFYPSA